MEVMTESVLSAQLAGIERRQSEGIRLTDPDRGLLAAVRRHEPGLVGRVEAVEQIEERRRVQAKRRKRQARQLKALADGLNR